MTFPTLLVYETRPATMLVLMKIELLLLDEIFHNQRVI